MKDGMSDEQICGNCFNREGEHTAEDQCIDDRGHLLGTEWKPIRSATNEELIEQGQNLAKNYKPGPRQAVPFMPQPVEERTAAPLFNDSAHMIGAILDRIDMAPNDDPIPYIREYVDGLRERNCIAERPMQTPIPEERTAEMEQLMGRLRETAHEVIVRQLHWKSEVHELQQAADACPGLDAAKAKFASEASPENILKLLAWRNA